MATKPAGESAEVVSLSEVPASPEQQLLRSMGSAPAGEPILLEQGVRASLQPGYAAASGRTCRRAELQYADGRSDSRLACATPNGWIWVPDVLPRAAR